MDLQNMLQTVLKSGAASSITKSTGLSQDQLQQVVSLGLPMILGGMANNAKTTDGARSLDSALEKDHLSSKALDETEPTDTNSLATEGSKILSHIFGNNTEQVGDAVSQKTGIDNGTIVKALVLLAPIVMAYMAKQKQDQHLDSTQIADQLSNQTTSDGVSLGDVVLGVIGMFNKK